MTALVHEIEVERPPEDVFAFVTDPIRFPEWQRDVVAARMESGSPGEVGATFVTSRRIAGIEVEQRQEVVEVTPPRTWRVRGVDGPVRADASVVVEPVGASRSLVRFTLDFAGPGVGRLLLPRVRRTAEKLAPVSYQTLKELLER